MAAYRHESYEWEEVLGVNGKDDPCTLEKTEIPRRLLSGLQEEYDLYERMMQFLKSGLQKLGQDPNVIDLFLFALTHTKTM